MHTFTFLNQKSYKQHLTLTQEICLSVHCHHSLRTAHLIYNTRNSARLNLAQFGYLDHTRSFSQNGDLRVASTNRSNALQ